MDPKYIDIAERAAWTGAQGAVALLIVELGDVSVWWAAPLALALSAGKTWLMTKTQARA